ncbi:MAG: response regulator, partial [Gammaproteobacteria bacterium]|nr:response regulator [Gammaproteobacteria bacterium]
EHVAEQAVQASWIFPDSHVLVVDDGAENRELLQLVLEDQGLRVSTAENGANALQMALNRRFDYILMDVQMPVMDGYTAVGEMRERGLTLPIVAMTAEAMQGSEQKCLDAGFSGYQSKPVDIDRLLSLLAADLGAEAGTRTLHANANRVPNQGAGPRLESGPILSSLPMDNPGYRRVAEKFVLRLEEQLAAMRSALQDEDLPELVSLTHWLKGSAGSVGFHQFTKPARELEKAAKSGRIEDIAELLTVVEGLFGRTRISDEAGACPRADTAKGLPACNFDIPDVIESVLDDGRPQFQSIIDRFAGRLSEQLEKMDKALRCENLEELAQLAHWLKGSAGTVGFGLFTQPAADLELHALTGQLAEARDCMELLNEMSRRIVLPQRASVGA